MGVASAASIIHMDSEGKEMPIKKILSRNDQIFACQGKGTIHEPAVKVINQWNQASNDGSSFYDNAEAVLKATTFSQIDLGKW